MRLDELVGVKQHQHLSLKDLIIAFQKESGYKKLGDGAFAYAFKHPTKPEVLKLWVADSAYEHFIEYCLAHKNEKHLPKLLGPAKKFSTFHRRLHGFPEKIMYVRMELLREIKPEDLGIKRNNSVMSVINYINRVVRANPKFFTKALTVRVDQESSKANPNRKGKTAIKWGSTEQDHWKVITDFWEDDKIPQHVLDLYLAAEKIDVAGNRWDLHSENIMVRPSTGELVITDPIVNNDDIETMFHLTGKDVPHVDEVEPQYTKSGRSKK